jgi:peptidoglycan/xylan/chitin deacetylase (PgdA/CDA1 family)
VFLRAALLAGAILITGSSVAHGSELKPIYRIDTNDKVAFLTIDDGWEKSSAIRDRIEASEIPVTTFITTQAIGDRAPFFERVSRWGSIQNHSISHQRFGASNTNLRQEICGAQRRITRTFGTQPWMLRPPYGDAANSPRVRSVARSCGITHIVMWDALVWNGRPAFRDKGLKPGSIILLHFNKYLEKDLAVALRLMKKAGLKPANLDDYLRPPSRFTATIPLRDR